MNAVKLKDNHMFDPEWTYDANQCVSQKDINGGLLKKKIKYKDYAVSVDNYGYEYDTDLVATRHCILNVAVIVPSGKSWWFTTFFSCRNNVWKIRVGNGAHLLDGTTCGPFDVTLRVYYYETSENAYEEARYTDEKALIAHLLPMGIMYTGTAYFTSPTLTSIKCASFKWIPNTASGYINKFGNLILYEGLLSDQSMYIITYSNGTYKTAKVNFTSTATYT